MLTTLITGYQRWISPYKGFRCGFAAIHETCSCSHFAQLAINKHGASLGWRLARDRMHRCTETVALYQAKIKKGKLTVRNSKKKKNNDSSVNPADICDCPILACDFSKQLQDGTLTDGCNVDWGPCDVSGVDAACDIGACIPSF